MKERIDIVREQERKFDHELSDQEKEFVLFKSIQNFIMYYDKIDFEPEKRIILEKIEYYFVQLENHTFSFNRSERIEIVTEFINPIAIYYKHRFGFKLYIKFKWIVSIAFIADLILLLFGILKYVNYIPLITILMTLKWCYNKIFYVNKNKYF